MPWGGGLPHIQWVCYRSRNPEPQSGQKMLPVQSFQGVSHMARQSVVRVTRAKYGATPRNWVLHQPVLKQCAIPRNPRKEETAFSKGDACVGQDPTFLHARVCHDLVTGHAATSFGSGRGTATEPKSTCTMLAAYLLLCACCYCLLTAPAACLRLALVACCCQALPTSGTPTRARYSGMPIQYKHLDPMGRMQGACCGS